MVFLWKQNTRQTKLQVGQQNYKDILKNVLDVLLNLGQESPFAETLEERELLTARAKEQLFLSWVVSSSQQPLPGLSYLVVETKKSQVTLSYYTRGKHSYMQDQLTFPCLPYWERAGESSSAPRGHFSGLLAIFSLSVPSHGLAHPLTNFLQQCVFI